jgi:hypothetical protein
MAVVAGTEPREEKGDTAADGLAGGHVGLLAKENDGLLAGWLPTEEMGSLEAKAGGRGGRGDVGEEEAVLFAKSEGAGDGEVMGEGLHGLGGGGGGRHLALSPARFWSLVQCRA